MPFKNITAKAIYTIDSKAGYTSMGIINDEPYLLVGDFTIKKHKKYGEEKHHKNTKLDKIKNSWVALYKVNNQGLPEATIQYPIEEGSVLKPDKVLITRDKVQGIAVFDDYVALSISFSSASSNLAIYHSPFDKKGTNHRLPGNNITEAYVVNKNNWITSIDMPPGSEDLSWDGHNLFMAFESGSKHYRDSWSKKNPIDDSFYLIDPYKVKELKKK